MWIPFLCFDKKTPEILFIKREPFYKGSKDGGFRPRMCKKDIHRLGISLKMDGILASQGVHLSENTPRGRHPDDHAGPHLLVGGNAISGSETDRLGTDQIHSRDRGRHQRLVGPVKIDLVSDRPLHDPRLESTSFLSPLPPPADESSDGPPSEEEAGPPDDPPPP